MNLRFEAAKIAVVGSLFKKTAVLEKKRVASVLPVPIRPRKVF